MTREERVRIQGDVTIGATITRPEGDGIRPALVLIAGSGKTDRDGNMGSVRLNMYRDLADMFTGWGYVTIRYDKRCTYETGGDRWNSGLDELVADAASVVRHMKSLPYVDSDKIVVCGHSEGGIIATLLSERERIHGMILLGIAGTSLRDALYYQNGLVAEEARRTGGIKGLILRRACSVERNIAKVDAMFERCMGTERNTILFGGGLVNAKWIREHASYSSEDLVSMVKGFDGPVFAVTGTADISAESDRLELFRGAPNVECHAPSGVNHILREVDDGNSILDFKRQYVRLSTEPFHRETCESMRGWLESRFP